MIVTTDAYPKFWLRTMYALTYRVLGPGVRPHYWTGDRWSPSGEYPSEADLVWGESLNPTGYLFSKRIANPGVGAPDSH